MTRKKRKPQPTGPKRRVPLPEGLPDRRAMESVLRGLVGGASGQNTPLDRATALMDQAFREKDAARRIALAKQARETCADCADAYVLLAEHEPSRNQTLELYQQGVAAGERALGPEVFRNEVGRFWGILATRPYMRARLGLALALWHAAKHDAAIEHLQALLRLNPNDNQGVRYSLASYLLFMDRDNDVAALLQAYPDEMMCSWAYTRALLAFRQQGDVIDTRRLLKTARKANPHVPAYLLEEKQLPPHQPGSFRLGEEDEACLYAKDSLLSWKSTLGAIPWLRGQVKPKKSADSAAEPKGPLGFIKKWLHTHLPQEEDIWQVGVRQMPAWMKIGGEMVRPWTLLVVSETTDLVLGHSILDEAPSSNALWDGLVKAMRHPVAGEPHRPSEIHFRGDPALAALVPHLEEVGIQGGVAEQLDLFDTVFADMCRHLGTTPGPGLIDVPGMTVEQVGRFYEAAAQFFQQALWKLLADNVAVKVECDRLESGPWYAVVMGQGGVTLGLALYEDLTRLRNLWTLQTSESFLETTGLNVTFGEEWDISVTDLDVSRRHGWTIARPDAYPFVIRKERGSSARQPLAWELELVTACLWLLPKFVRQQPQENLDRKTYNEQIGSAPCKVVLSWVTE